MGEAIAIAAGGLDDIGVADGLEFAAEGADTGEMMSLSGGRCRKACCRPKYFVRTVIS